MDHSNPGCEMIADPSKGSDDCNAFTTRPLTLRPAEFSLPESFWDEKRTSSNISESDAAKLKYLLTSSFLDMEKPQTYKQLEESADRFFRLKLLQKSMRCPPDYEDMALTGYLLTQHDVMIIRGYEKFEKKLNAIKSFPNDVAGDWRNMEGDMLLFPAPEGNTDYAHLKRTLRDIILSIRCTNNIKNDEHSKKVGRRTTSDPLERHDKSSSVFVDIVDGVTLSVFKPLFHDTNFIVATIPDETNKTALTLEFLQRAVLIYMKFADLAMASHCLGHALALCRMQRYCCDHISYILDCDLDYSAYTHIITNWMLANVFVKLYDRLQEGYGLDEDSLDYDVTKEEIEAMYACIADMRADLWKMTRNRKIIEYPWKFPREEAKLLEAADYYFRLISAPLHWRRTTYNKLFVQCKSFLMQLVKIIEMFAKMTKSAHDVDSTKPQDSYPTESQRRYHRLLRGCELPVVYDRPLAEQKLRDLLMLVDGACNSAYSEHIGSTYCNDLKAVLSVMVGVLWKISAVSEASNALETADTNNNLELLSPEDSLIQAREAYAYKKIREKIKESFGNFCGGDHNTLEALERSHGFRINLIMKSNREEVVLQIEQERRDASYTAGVLALVECLFSVIKVADYEKPLRGSGAESYRIMAADILLGMSSVYLIRYEKEHAKPTTNEESKERSLKALLHNARYYHHAFAMYVARYPYVVQEVCRTYIDQTELVTDFYCRGGSPLAALAQDLLALRRLMPLLPVVWECCILGHWPNGPVGYKKVEMTEIKIPFHKSSIESLFGQLSSRLLSALELVQLSEENLTLDGDSLHETSGDLKDYAKNIVEELSNAIERIAVDDVKIVEQQSPLETAAGEIALIICTARGDNDLNDSGYQKVKLAQQLSKCLAKRFNDYLMEILPDPIPKGRPTPKRSGLFSMDRKVMAFSSTFAVLCGMLGVHAVDFHWPNLKLGEMMERLSSELVDDICDSFYNQCTPEDRLGDESNLNKMAAFLVSCERDISLSTTQSKNLMAACKISRIIVMVVVNLKRFSVHGNLHVVPFAEMMKKTTQLFAFVQTYTAETWRTHSALIAKYISIAVLKTELKVPPEVEEELCSMEPKFEGVTITESELVYGKPANNTRPNTKSVVGNLPANVEQFHVMEEIEFSRTGKMYTDKIFGDIFYCTNSLYKSRAFSIETPLLRLINFLRVDLDRHLKEKGQQPPCKLFGTYLTEELLTKLNGLKTSLELPPGDGTHYANILKAFHALDKMFFGGTASSILRGALHDDFELDNSP